MATQVARRIGNAPRCNPRAYSTQAQSAFPHRNPPPMPSLDHLAQPEQSFVSLLTSQVHSVLGSAWYTLQAPVSWWSFMPVFSAAPAPQPQPAAAFAEEEHAVPLDWALTFQQERGWRYYGEDTQDARIKLYSPNVSRSPLVKRSLSPFTEIKQSFSVSRLYACALVDAANHTLSYESMTEPMTESQSSAKEESRFKFQTHRAFAAERPRLALVRVPANRRPLDGFGSAPQEDAPSLEYLDAPSSPQQDRLQAAAAVIVATGVVVSGAAAVISAMLGF